MSAPGRRHYALLVSSLERGGAERVAVNLCNAWAARGDRATLVITYLAARGSGFEIAAGVEVVYLADEMAGRRSPLPSYFAKLAALRAWIRRARPDAIVSFLTNVNVTSIVARAGLRVPLLVSERADPAAGVEMPWALHLARALAYGFADVLVAQTPEAADRLRPRLLRAPAIEVVPNPLPAALERLPARARHDAPQGRIVAFGRLYPPKGFDRLLHAYARAFRAGDPWTLSIHGEGPQRSELESLIDRLGLRGRAALCGSTDRPWDAMAGAQLFALSSVYEGFPNAMLEAMSLGLACVSFDCPSGPRHLAGAEGAAELVADGDVDAFAATLRRLADDPAGRARMGARAAARVRREFSEAAALGLWDAAIARACRRNGSGT